MADLAKPVADPLDEVQRIRRVADQLCTAHASLRDRYAFYAISLDLVILLLSAGLVATAFVDPALALVLTPLGLPTQLWIGLISLATFALSLVQLRTNWKGRSEAHARSFSMYAEVKREAGYLVASSAGKVAVREFQRLAARYDMASDVGIGVPEADFLTQKKKHLVKVQLSKILDQRPGAVLWVERLKVLARDMFPPK